MKYLYLFFVIVFTMTSPLYAQDETKQECGTPSFTKDELKLQPWYNKEGYLEKLQDSLNNLFRIYDEKAKGQQGYLPELRVNGNYFVIPIKFWVYTKNGSAAANLYGEYHYQAVIDRMNAACKSSNIPALFFMRCVSYIENSEAFDLEDSEACPLADQHRDISAVNIHVINRFSSQDKNGVFYSLCNAIFVDRPSIIRGLGTSTPTHEVGHFFGVGGHTNEFADIICLREPVSRGWLWSLCPNPFVIASPFYFVLPWQRCLTTGDFLCDTDAAPASIDNSEVNYGRDIVNQNSDCIYTGTQTDYRGERYHPDLQNYMIAGFNRRNACRSHFSPQQTTIICNKMNADFPNSGQPWIGDPDMYEPDNHQTSARIIKVGETQYHSQDLMTCKPDDWVRIYKPENTTGYLGTQTLVIDEIAGLPMAIGSVNIYKGGAIDVSSGDFTSLTQQPLQITQIGNKRTIKIPCSLLEADANILIQITKTANNSLGWYKVSLSSDIATLPTFANNTPTTICVGQTLSLNNLPAGAVVTWAGTNVSVSPNANNTANIIGWTINSDNRYNVVADIQYQGCSYKINKDFIPQQPGTLQITDDTDYNLSELCITRAYSYSASTTGTWSNFQWSVSPSTFRLSGSTSLSVELTRNSNGYFTLTLNALDGCGNSASRSISDRLDLPTIAECRRRFVRLAPNPTSDFIRIDLSDYDDSKDLAVKIVSQFGNIMYDAKITSIVTEINVGNYPKGVYFVELITDFGVDKVSFIVQ